MKRPRKMKPLQKPLEPVLTLRASNSKLPLDVQIKRRIAERLWRMVKGFRGAMAAAFWKDMRP